MQIRTLLAAVGQLVPDLCRALQGASGQGQGGIAGRARAKRSRRGADTQGELGIAVGALETDGQELSEAVSAGSALRRRMFRG